MDPFLGMIMLVGFNFAPQGWALCNGQLLPISSNQALFTLLGTIYGGDGRTTFALPDLRGRAPIHMGEGAGLSPRTIGQEIGQEDTTLVTPNLPPHGHPLLAKSTEGDSLTPTNNVIAKSGQGDPDYFSGAQDTAMSSQSIGNTGNGQSFSNMSPVLTMNYIIALTGIYPTTD